MKTILISLISLILLSCNKEQTINYEALATALDSILVEDQKYRSQMNSVSEAYGWNSDEMRQLWNKQNKIDSTNLLRIIEIIEQVGTYPGQSLVGGSASEAAFYVLQHAPDSIQDKYYETIVTAGKNKELKANLVSMYQDRYLMHRNEPQIYGTQIRIEHLIDKKTGLERDSAYVWPIADTTKIDSLRFWNGHGPLEDYLNNFGLSRWK